MGVSFWTLDHGLFDVIKNTNIFMTSSGWKNFFSSVIFLLKMFSTRLGVISLPLSVATVMVLRSNPSSSLESWAFSAIFFADSIERSRPYFLALIRRMAHLNSKSAAQCLPSVLRRSVMKDASPIFLFRKEGDLKTRRFARRHQ